MSMVSTQPAPTMATQICSWRESMYITMKHRVANTSPVLSWLILSQEPWTLLDQDRLERSTSQITLYLDRVVLETTGLKDIIQREPS